MQKIENPLLLDGIFKEKRIGVLTMAISKLKSKAARLTKGKKKHGNTRSQEAEESAKNLAIVKDDLIKEINTVDLGNQHKVKEILSKIVGLI